MKPIPRAVLKNLVVAVTLGLAAVATWALTDLRAPAIEAAAQQAQNG